MGVYMRVLEDFSLDFFQVIFKDFFISRRWENSREAFSVSSGIGMVFSG